MSTTIAEFHPEAWAANYAKRHLALDQGIDAIYYLPKNAPEREIRFLEINHLISEMMPLEPIDFGVDSGTPNEHRLYVLDVTPAQWEAINQGQLQLPDGWDMTDRRVFDRSSP